MDSESFGQNFDVVRDENPFQITNQSRKTFSLDAGRKAKYAVLSAALTG